MYTRMEEISFRTSMTVLAGVVAFAAVVASVSVLMSQSSGPRHAALGRPATVPAAAGPTSALVNPGSLPPAAPSTSPARATPAPTSHARPAAGTPPPATAAGPAAVAPAAGPTPAVSPSLARISSRAAAATWWSWWLRVHRGSGQPRGNGFPRLSRGGGWPGGRWPGRR